MWVKINDKYINTSTIVSIYKKEVDTRHVIIIELVNDRYIYGKKAYEDSNEAEEAIVKIAKYFGGVDRIPLVSF